MTLVDARYRGEVRKSMWHGKGSWVALNRRFIERPSGKLLHANGDIYEGDFLNDAKNGEGVMVEANGDHIRSATMSTCKAGYRSQVQGRMERQRAMWKGKLHLCEWCEDVSTTLRKLLPSSILVLVLLLSSLPLWRLHFVSSPSQ